MIHFCITEWVHTISALLSAIFAGCMVFYACKQTKRQIENVRIALYQERIKFVQPLLEAYNLYAKGVLYFFRDYCSEDKDISYPIRATELLRLIEYQLPQADMLFGEKSKDMKSFFEQYKKLVNKSCELCSYLTKVPKKDDTFNILLITSESNTDDAFINTFQKSVNNDVKKLLLELEKQMEDWSKDVSIMNLVTDLMKDLYIGNIK